MDTFIISCNGNPRKSLRLTGRDGPARLNYLDGLVRLCHSGGHPRFTLTKVNAFAWLARGNPVKWLNFKNFDFRKNIELKWRYCPLLSFVDSFKNTKKALSTGVFLSYLKTPFEKKEQQLISGNSAPEIKVLSFEWFKQFTLNSTALNGISMFKNQMTFALSVSNEMTGITFQNKSKERNL